MNVPRHGSAEALKSRELIVLAAEAALANGHYEMAREQVRAAATFAPACKRARASSLGWKDYARPL
jgi:hypothetical protein